MKPIPLRVEIDRPPAEVFAFLCDFENNPRFQGGIRSARWTSRTTYDQVAHFLGKDIVSSFEVVEHVPGRVKIRSTAGPFPIAETRTVQDRGGKSLVEVLVEGDAKGFFRLASPVLRLLVRRSVTADYARLKEILEAGA